MAHFTWVDYSIIALLIFSVGIGLVRGFLREVLSLFTWVVAFVLASVFATRLAAVFTSSDSQATIVSSAEGSSQPISLVSVGISYIAIFIGVLILGKIITHFVSSAAEGTGISFINRFLGGIFGFARGTLIVLVAIFLIQLTPISEQSNWTESPSVQYAQPYVKKIEDMVEPRLEDLKSKMDQSLSQINSLYQQTRAS